MDEGLRLNRGGERNGISAIIIGDYRSFRMKM